jgi:uncharacterized protein (DUF1697 family)
MTTFVTLLRAINVGKRQVPMRALTSLVEGLGFAEVRTYVASGNLVFRGRGGAEAVEAKLEKAIAERFGFPVDVIVRTAEQWTALLHSNPFPQQTEKEPNRVLLLLSKLPQPKDAADKLMERAQHGEMAKGIDGGLWIHFAQGVGPSKITPNSIDRACGSPTTGRNLRTVAKLAEMAGAAK